MFFFASFGPYYVILAWTGFRAEKLVVDGHADTHTDRQIQTTTIPEGNNWLG